MPKQQGRSDERIVHVINMEDENDIDLKNHVGVIFEPPRIGNSL